MANVTYVNPTLLPTFMTGSGVITVATSTQVTIAYGSTGYTETYYGSVSYNTSGFISGGVVTSFVAATNGQTAFSISGLQLSATQVQSLVLGADSAALAAFIFSGSDTITGSNLNDPIAGFSGADTIVALGGNDSVLGGDGADDINGNQGADIVLGDAGADTVRGGQGDDTIDGGDGDDPHVNGNIGDDIVYGGAGADSVYGGQGRDTLDGEGGNDLLSGDLGNDILTGGGGADRFVLRAGSSLDWAADFRPTEGDRIQLTPGQAYTVTSSGGQVVIDIGNGDQLGLAGIASGTFSADWIVFA